VIFEAAPHSYKKTARHHSQRKRYFYCRKPPNVFSEISYNKETAMTVDGIVINNMNALPGMLVSAGQEGNSSATDATIVGIRKIETGRYLLQYHTYLARASNPGTLKTVDFTFSGANISVNTDFGALTVSANNVQGGSSLGFSINASVAQSGARNVDYTLWRTGDA
jgi:hypothetical protein